MIPLDKFSKGNNSVNNVGGVMVSFLCTPPDDICTKFDENISKGF